MINKIIIFPDIHGRKFWKKPFEKYKDDDSVMFLFLGDYLDPYDWEVSSHKEAWNNFVEIQESFAKIPEDRVVFLLGNHDLHYLEYFWNMRYGCRRDKNYFKLMNDVISKDNFKIAYSTSINGKKYLFTHAGVLNSWAKHLKAFYYNNYDIEEICSQDFLNSLKKSPKGLNMLWMVSWERGGDNNVGSCIWADVHEHFEYEQWDIDEFYKPLNIYQIFGHTLSYPDFYECFIGDNFAMLDCESAFELDTKTGKLEKCE